MKHGNLLSFITVTNAGWFSNILYILGESKKVNKVFANFSEIGWNFNIKFYKFIHSVHLRFCVNNGEDIEFFISPPSDFRALKMGSPTIVIHYFVMSK